jgi:hypothetical protein
MFLPQRRRGAATQSNLKYESLGVLDILRETTLKKSLRLCGKSSFSGLPAIHQGGATAM